MSDLGVVLVSSGSGLVGAAIGAAGALTAARKTRVADRRKSCVDRVLRAANDLQRAYLDYASRAKNGVDDPVEQLKSFAAVREYKQAVGMLGVIYLRDEAFGYLELLKEHYAMHGVPKDELDADRKIITNVEIDEKHDQLVEKLRNYESR